MPQVRQGGVLRREGDLSGQGLASALPEVREGGKTLTSGGRAEQEGRPCCNHPCYAAMFSRKASVWLEPTATLSGKPGGGDPILGRSLGHCLGKCQASPTDVQGFFVAPNALNKHEHLGKKKCKT